MGNQDQESDSAKKPKLEMSDVKSMTAKRYIDELIIPTLLKAVSSANQKRPIDPIEYIANYLLQTKEKEEALTAAVPKTGGESA